MASGCVPLFLDLGRLPAQTLALYPRAHLRAALRLPGLAISPSATSPSATSSCVGARGRHAVHGTCHSPLGLGLG